MIMKKQNARERLLDTAADLFAQRGYHAVGINEIIAKSETAKATFYHHFPSKEQLCVSWLQEAHERSEKQHAAIVASPEPAEEKILAAFHGLKDWMHEKDYRGCPFTNTVCGLDRASDSIKAQVDVHKASIRNFFVRLASDADPSGSADEVKRRGMTLFLLYSGATTESQNARADWPIDAAIEIVQQMLGEMALIGA